MRMMGTVLQHIRNWFVTPDGVHFSTFTIEDGSIDLDFLQEGQWFRIIGSVFNDGVYEYTTDCILTDETFEGAIWALAVPPAFSSLVEEIESYQDANIEAKPYQSESFGGYSYSVATDASGAPLTWKAMFRSRLNDWRKL